MRFSRKTLGIPYALFLLLFVVLPLLVLTVAAVFTLNTSWCQQKVLNYAVSLLEERLQTLQGCSILKNHNNFGWASTPTRFNTLHTS